MRRIRVLFNPRSGVFTSIGETLKEMEAQWGGPDVELCFQLSRDPADGKAKTRRAIADGVETIVVVGGDGMVNSIGSELVGTEVVLGVIPTGSGNGFARHFNIPLTVSRAIAALSTAEPVRIDVGLANDIPFLVTCSLAWDAAIVRSFEKSPVRGVLPYVLAGAYELINYVPQPIEMELDNGQVHRFQDPLVCTVANLTQFGGGARIAPSARPDDGYLELVVACRRDAVRLVADFVRFFDGSLDQVEEVTTLRFSDLTARRSSPAQMQVDGELVDAPAEVRIRVLPKALSVLVPTGKTR